MENKNTNTVEYIKMIKESPEKKRSYIFLAISLVASILLIVFAIRPTILTITRINKEITEKERLNTLLDTKITTLDALSKQYIDLGSDLNNLRLIFPSDGNFSLFMSNIEAVASRNGFSLNGISFEKYTTDMYSISTKVLLPWSVRLSVKGKPANLINFLRDLEGLPMYPVIESISYSNQQDSNGMVSYGLNLRIYKIDSDNFYD